MNQYKYKPILAIDIKNKLEYRITCQCLFDLMIKHPELSIDAVLTQIQELSNGNRDFILYQGYIYTWKGIE